MSNSIKTPFGVINLYLVAKRVNEIRETSMSPGDKARITFLKEGKEIWSGEFNLFPFGGEPPIVNKNKSLSAKVVHTLANNRHDADDFAVEHVPA
jgi:hypothetical protein